MSALISQQDVLVRKWPMDDRYIVLWIAIIAPIATYGDLPL